MHLVLSLHGGQLVWRCFTSPFIGLALVAKRKDRMFDAWEQPKSRRAAFLRFCSSIPLPFSLNRLIQFCTADGRQCFHSTTQISWKIRRQWSVVSASNFSFFSFSANELHWALQFHFFENFSLTLVLTISSTLGGITHVSPMCRTSIAGTCT